MGDFCGRGSGELRPAEGFAESRARRQCQWPRDLRCFRQSERFRGLDLFRLVTSPLALRLSFVVTPNRPKRPEIAPNVATRSGHVPIATVLICLSLYRQLA